MSLGNLTNDEIALLKKCPKPPKGADDHQIMDWAQKVAVKGGSAALRLVFSTARAWPPVFPKEARARLFSPLKRLELATQERERVDAEHAREEQRKRRERASARRLPGWGL